LTVACTSILDIDNDYVLEAAEGGNAGGTSGQVGATGGAPVTTGGAGGKGGTSGSPGVTTGGSSSGGVDAGTGGIAVPATCDQGVTCDAGMKCCTGRDPRNDNPIAICTGPSVFVGCTLDGCDPCPPPPEFSDPVCRDEVCGFDCWPGFLKEGNLCVPDGPDDDAGGSGGTPGTGGAPACDVRNCTGCSLFGPFPCCTPSNRCGCTYAPMAYCVPS
jgi:hypothetical protein